MRLLRYNNHICYASGIIAVFRYFRCPNFDTFFNRRSNLEQHLLSCIERVKHVHPKNVFEILKTLFDKLDSFNIKKRVNRNYSRTSQCSTLSQFAFKKSLSQIQKQQRGYRNMSQHQHPCPQILWRNHFPFAILTLIISLHP